MNYGYIYLTTNLKNGKRYIGQHKSDKFDLNYIGSGKILKQAILKDGIENFKCEILEWCSSKEALDEAEARYIKIENATESSSFYNLVPGGRGKSIKGCIYITNGEINKKVLPEDLDKYLDQGFRLGGPKQSQETIEKRRLSNTGKKRSDATRKNISQSHLGHKASDETKEKLRKAKLGKTTYRKGKIMVSKLDEHLYINPEDLDKYIQMGYERCGIKHKNPEESSKNYSQARRNKVAVNDGFKYYFIDKNDLDTYLSNGYKKGKPVKTKNK